MHKPTEGAGLLYCVTDNRSSRQQNELDISNSKDLLAEGWVGQSETANRKKVLTVAEVEKVNGETAGG